MTFEEIQGEIGGWPINTTMRKVLVHLLEQRRVDNDFAKGLIGRVEQQADAIRDMQKILRDGEALEEMRSSITTHRSVIADHSDKLILQDRRLHALEREAKGHDQWLDKNSMRLDALEGGPGADASLRERALAMTNPKLDTYSRMVEADRIIRYIKTGQYVAPPPPDDVDSEGGEA